ncbi:hypothetical protein QYE76_036050 [Lolium multiflorum]|uniref:Uncharacterized protein n=1 Tax=Lolium multiflorum TaxID=4521 RepID=A0AAD8VLR7_LOLMU|nr:hypothetical protein QYE76_036050 [Lolium multiflorum]
MAIEQGRLIFNQYAMKVDTHPFPVNMVECTYPGGCQPGFSFNINMVGPGHHSGKDGDEAAALVARTQRKPFHAIGSVTMASATSREEGLSRLGTSTLSPLGWKISRIWKTMMKKKKTGRKTIPTTFFIVDSKSTYAVLLGRDWIHANCCIPSTMHQCVRQWDGDEVEVVHANDSAEISTAGMNAWETAGQEPLSGINLDDCERIDVTKDGVRLVLSTGLTV